MDVAAIAPVSSTRRRASRRQRPDASYHEADHDNTDDTRPCRTGRHREFPSDRIKIDESQMGTGPGGPSKMAIATVRRLSDDCLPPYLRVGDARLQYAQENVFVSRSLRFVCRQASGFDSFYMGLSDHGNVNQLL